MLNYIFSVNVNGKEYYLPLCTSEIWDLTENKALEDIKYTFNGVLVNVDIDWEDLEGLNLDTLNDLAEELTTISNKLDTVNAYCELENHGHFISNYEEIIRNIRDCSIMLYHNINAKDFAKRYITELYNIDELDLPQLLYNNVDWQGVFNDIDEADETTYGILVQNC